MLDFRGWSGSGGQRRGLPRLLRQVSIASTPHLFAHYAVLCFVAKFEAGVTSQWWFFTVIELLAS